MRGRKRHYHGKRHRSRKPHKKKKHFHKKQSTFRQLRRFALRHPVVSSVGSIVCSIVLLRIAFLNRLFGNSLGEFRAWFVFFALLLGILGFAALFVWYRNNVSDFNIQANLGWRRR